MENFPFRVRPPAIKVVDHTTPAQSCNAQERPRETPQLPAFSLRLRNFSFGHNSVDVAVTDEDRLCCVSFCLSEVL